MIWPFKTKWAHVATLKFVGKYDTYHFHLFESNNGKRRMEVRKDGKEYNIEKDFSNVKSLDIYQEKIYRWLNGRRDPDIPRYDEVDQDDTANFLKGKI